MRLQPTTLILLVVVSGDAALLNRIAQRLPARRVRDALIAPAISAAPTLTEPERVDTYWKQDDSELSQRLARMLEATPSLQTPTYRPTTWAKGSKANFALAFARSRAGELRRKARNLRAANLYRCPHTSTRSPSRPRPHPKPRADQVEPPLSGGAPRYSACDGAPDIVVEWAKDEAAVALRLANPNPNPLPLVLTANPDPNPNPNPDADPEQVALPPDAPIVVFLHTITGTAAQTRWLMPGASARGWRACVFVRRGHNERQRLSAPSFNLLGDVGDVERQLDAVRRTYPRASFVGMIGISAGSGLLISYLGRAGTNTPVGAACAICPAWDVRAAFAQMGVTQPDGERTMLRQIKRGFLRRNARLLRRWDESAYEACLAATSLPEMLAAHAPFAMRQRGATGAEYLAAHDPMEDRHGVMLPTLVLNAEDDFVCPAALARPEVIVDEQPGCLLLVTRSGSHVAFNEGRSLRRSPFHLRVSLDFLEAARATAEGTAREADREAPRPEALGGLRGVVVPTRAAGGAPARPRDEDAVRP